MLPPPAGPMGKRAWRAELALHLETLNHFNGLWFLGNFGNHGGRVSKSKEFSQRPKISNCNSTEAFAFVEQPRTWICVNHIEPHLSAPLLSRLPFDGVQKQCADALAPSALRDENPIHEKRTDGRATLKKRQYRSPPDGAKDAEMLLKDVKGDGDQRAHGGFVASYAEQLPVTGACDDR